MHDSAERQFPQRPHISHEKYLVPGQAYDHKLQTMQKTKVLMEQVKKRKEAMELHKIAMQNAQKRIGNYPTRRKSKF